MKNGKRNGIGVSERSLGRQLPKRDSSTALGMTVSKKALRRRETGERGSHSAQKEIDAKALWKQLEDVVVPQLRLSVIDHVVYMHLLRHSQLEGKRRLHFSIPWLANNVNLSTCPTRDAVRRLAACGVVRMVERSKQGHVAEVRLPEEVRGVRAKAAARAREAARKADPSDIEEVDFMRTLELRRTIHAREGGRCFYCLRRVAPRLECLDHVVPRARVGCNSYRNLVSACMECNAQKGEQPAEEYLRWLFREHRLGAAELRGRFEALELLAAGKLRPMLPSQGGEGGRRA
jgi:5-methylcytosine-specific restriction endonuclease McrA